jgi:hypothetical protein
MINKLRKLYCLIWHQYMRECGYMKENGYYVCAECYTLLSKITGDKSHYESDYHE